jgi:hypothetical protein
MTTTKDQVPISPDDPPVPVPPGPLPEPPPGPDRPPTPIDDPPGPEQPIPDAPDVPPVGDPPADAPVRMCIGSHAKLLDAVFAVLLLRFCNRAATRYAAQNAAADE